MAAPYTSGPHTSGIITLTPDQVAQIDPGILADAGVFADPGNPRIARSASRQQVALTPARMADFLESLQVMGSVSIACERAGVARQTAYRARRRSPGFARAWDAALVAARTVAETELACRAINGVEEAVYYHGEEVARRRRYDSRLLLAHLARLDKVAERLDVAATLPLLDDQIEALRAAGSAGGDTGGEGEGADLLPAHVPHEALRQAQDERDWVADPAAMAEREAARAAAAAAAAVSPQDTVTPVTPCGLAGDAARDPLAILQGEEEPDFADTPLLEAQLLWLEERYGPLSEKREAYHLRRTAPGIPAAELARFGWRPPASCSEAVGGEPASSSEAVGGDQASSGEAVGGDTSLSGARAAPPVQGQGAAEGPMRG